MFAPASFYLFFFFFNDTATTEIYTLSLHDALPISGFARRHREGGRGIERQRLRKPGGEAVRERGRAPQLPAPGRERRVQERPVWQRGGAARAERLRRESPGDPASPIAARVHLRGPRRLGDPP